MKYKSKNRAKQRMKVDRLRERFCNQRDDFLHKQSRQIANAYDCVCIKDPAQGVSYDFGWALFKFFLKYKLLEKGKSLVSVDNILSSKMLQHSIKQNALQLSGCLIQMLYRGAHGESPFYLCIA